MALTLLTLSSPSLCVDCWLPGYGSDTVNPLFPITVCGLLTPWLYIISQYLGTFCPVQRDYFQILGHFLSSVKKRLFPNIWTHSVKCEEETISQYLGHVLSSAKKRLFPTWRRDYFPIFGHVLSSVKKTISQYWTRSVKCEEDYFPIFGHFLSSVKKTISQYLDTFCQEKAVHFCHLVHCQHAAMEPD